MTTVDPRNTPGSAARRFGSTEHLASEAVAAYVDGEMKMNAYLRASQHLTECIECASDVEAQRQARHALRAANTQPVAMPLGLLSALGDIPSRVVDEPLPSARRSTTLFSAVLRRSGRPRD